MSVATPRFQQQTASTGVLGIVPGIDNRFYLIICTFFILTSLAAWSPASFATGRCDRDIRVGNMVSNAVFTLIFRSFNGRINNWSDVGASLSYGAGAGYLFYRSREMISAGDESRGLATAYLASSITENTTKGRHPLSHLRYGVGPTEVEWATPFAAGGHHLSFSLNAIDAMGVVALMASGRAENFTLRNGIVTADNSGGLDSDFSAYTLNRTIVMRPEQAGDQGLWHHEMIHATQYLQYSSFGSNNYDAVDWEKIDRFGLRQRIAQTGLNLNLRVEWFNTLMNSLDHQNDYQDRTRELEAARMAQNTSPTHDVDNHTCSAQVGFQFEF